MKYNFFLLLLFCSPLIWCETFSQNLIPNGDFELGPDSSTNSTTGWFINGPDFWIVTNETPDRIVWGSIDPYRDNDSAQSGKAYVIFYGPTREAGKAVLQTPLQSGKQYRLTYHIDIDTNFYGGAGQIIFKFNGGDSISSPLQFQTGKWERISG